MKYVSYRDASGIPNVIVDGAATTNTAVTLSHWPKSGTPADLKADTSAEIVFRYLDRPSFHTDADAVSNNHYDEDGLVGIFALVDRVAAERYRDLLIDVARAGDFGVWTRRDAARIALALMAYADRATSPLPASLFDRPYPEVAHALYGELLTVLPRLCAGVDGYRALWRKGDDELAATDELLDHRALTIDEHPTLDFAVVRGPSTPAGYHPFAIHNRTTCTRLLVLSGDEAEVQYRYEGWVQLVSRRPAPRVDLSALAEELNREERSGGRWIFDGVDQITPTLHLEDASATTIAHDHIRRRLEEHLEAGIPAWNPYD